MEIKTVRPALPDSYEQLCHATGLARFMPGLSVPDWDLTWLK
jgi:hypothetical protein